MFSSTFPTNAVETHSGSFNVRSFSRRQRGKVTPCGVLLAHIKNGEIFGSKINGRLVPPINFICKVSPSRVLPQQVARSTDIVCAARVALKQNEAMDTFLPTTIHTAIVARSTPSPQSLRDSSPIIMVFASKLRENRFVKFISFDDGEHSCYNFGS